MNERLMAESVDVAVLFSGKGTPRASLASREAASHPAEDARRAETPAAETNSCDPISSRILGSSKRRDISDTAAPAAVSNVRLSETLGFMHRLLSRNGNIDDLSIPDIEGSETSDIDVDEMPEICDSD